MFKIPFDKNITIVLNEPMLAPVIAVNAPIPFAYITPSGENMEHAFNIFENHNLGINSDVYVVAAEELDKKIPCLPDNIKLSVGEKVNIKVLGEKITKYGYLRMQKIDQENEYSVRGDIVDIWPLNAPYPLRIMFFGNEIEAIKILDINSFTHIKSVEHCEIAPLPDFCTVDEWQTVFDSLKNYTKTFFIDNTLTEAKIPPVDEDIRIIRIQTKKSSSALTIRTSPVANYFSALSVLIPELIWNVNSRNKTVLVFVGGSRACEKYMDTKGVPYVISTVDNFKYNQINVIRKQLGVSFEIVDESIVVYSLHSPKNAPQISNIHLNETAKKYGEFVLPQVGELVVHEKHGLGRFLGIKKMQIANAERDYAVLQYDGGTFVYLPPDRMQELSNYFGPPRRLDRI